MPVALVFPGQGSQREGMARPWRHHPAARRWREASELLGRDVARLGTDAGAEELRDPWSCQVGLFVHHVVLLEAYRAEGGEEPAVVAGHSLGEYDALVAAGVLEFQAALELVDARARATQEAARAQPGTLLACLGYGVEELHTLCQEIGTHVANDNAPGQVVVAGTAEGLAELRRRLEALPARGRVVELDVAAAYHSPHMASALEPFGAALDAAGFADADRPVVANVDAEVHTAAADWPQVLRDQLVSPVRWRESVATLARFADTVVELGASPVLTGLVKRTDGGLDRVFASTPAELERHT